MEQILLVGGTSGAKLSQKESRRDRYLFIVKATFMPSTANSFRTSGSVQELVKEEAMSNCLR